MEDLYEISSDPDFLIPKLCKQFYKQGWVSGTGGGISIRLDNSIYVAPSGVQKELIKQEDLFVLKRSGEIVKRPVDPKLTLSQCFPLFQLVYFHRNAGAVIHSHHMSIVLLTNMIKDNIFKISNQEMIKGIIKGTQNIRYRNDEILQVPIIQNTPFESDLAENFEKAILDYPETNAVLVRNHGVYIWGKNWVEAKTQAECYHYLFELAVKMTQCQNLKWNF